MGKSVSSSPDFLETAPQLGPRQDQQLIQIHSYLYQYCSLVKFPHRSVDIPEELRSPASLWTHYICVQNSQWRQRPDTPLLAPEYFFLLDDASAECKQILSDEDKISTDFN